MMKKNDWLLLFVALAIAGISHGYNMLHYPYFENDEGTYLSQAWSLITQGKLAPYTYWYDHAPGGWIFTALWVKLTGGFFTFGPAMYTGRVFMLVIHLASSILVFSITKKLAGSSWPGLFAVLLFSLTPLGIYFQRRLLLDNIMIFWVLLSFSLLLIRERLTLKWIWLSAITFGIALLTKENAVFFLPGMMVMITSSLSKTHRLFGLFQWVMVVAVLVMFYLVYAALKQELLPSVGGAERVSLLETFFNQLGRGEAIPFWQSQSDFRMNFYEWLNKDPWLVLAGFAAWAFGIIGSFAIPKWRTLVLLTTFFWLFLLRGKLVIDFYIIPLLPLLSIQIALLIHYVFTRLHQSPSLLWGVLSFAIGFVRIEHSWEAFYVDETTPQIQGTVYVMETVPKDAVIAVDSTALIDLWEHGYDKADWFWKFWFDKEIQAKVKFDWKNIDYLLLSHEMLKQIGIQKIPDDMLKNVLLHSDNMKMWGPINPSTHIDIEDYISTNGDWTALYRLYNQDMLVLQTAYREFKKAYIVSYGQVIDPDNQSTTTSQGQAYGLLMAVVMNDEALFDGIWQWTKDHLQHRQTDKLISSKWIKIKDSYRVGDSTSRAAADQDIAAALLMAASRFNNEQYFNDAKVLLSDIWKKEVKRINGKYIVAAGSNSDRPGGFLTTVTHWSPAWYRLFAKADSSHPWYEVAEDSYYFLNLTQRIAKNSNRPTPNIMFVREDNGAFETADRFTNDPYTLAEPDDSFRSSWQLLLDVQGFNSGKANAVSELIDYQILDSALPTPFDYEQGRWEGVNELYHHAQLWLMYALYAGQLSYNL
jgi:4-amino-4-deoxy-L-arabinose transferase-like glycosyltransferase